MPDEMFQVINQMGGDDGSLEGIVYILGFYDKDSEIINSVLIILVILKLWEN